MKALYLCLPLTIITTFAGCGSTETTEADYLPFINQYVECDILSGPFEYSVFPLDMGDAVEIIDVSPGPGQDTQPLLFWISDGTVFALNDAAVECAPRALDAPSTIKHQLAAATTAPANTGA